MDPSLVRLSRFVSRVLRHDPGRIGLELDSAGWADVGTLLAKARGAGVQLTAETLDEIVARNDKQRFAYSSDKTLIRANQGHTIPVDLSLSPLPPPKALFHGTGERAVSSILREGLTNQGRHHVHLSADPVTAERVGQRHGRPAVFVIATEKMHADGVLFYRSVNGVWLVDCVHPHYLSLMHSPTRPGFARPTGPAIR